MTDMNETLAEIRRRGAERIRARKQTRSRVIALCVPLVLCVTAVLAMPEFGQPTNVSRPVETMIPVNTQNHTEPVENTGLPSLEAPAVVLTVTGKGLDRSYTDKELLEKLEYMLSGWMVSGHVMAQATDRTSAGAPTRAQENGDAIILRVDDGQSVRVFELYSTGIYELNAGKGYSISAAQYKALLELLELE